MIEKYDGEFLVVCTLETKQEKLAYIKKFLPIGLSIKHEAMIYSIISKPEGRMLEKRSDYKKVHNQHVGNMFVVKKCELYIQRTEKELNDSANEDNGSNSDASDSYDSSGSSTVTNEDNVDASIGNVQPGNKHGYNFKV